jgi:hypothetical protein
VYKELAILGLLSFLTFISEVRAGMRPHILPVRMSTTIRSRRTVAPVCCADARLVLSGMQVIFKGTASAERPWVISFEVRRQGGRSCGCISPTTDPRWNQCDF